jgi:hypothetical protein
MGKFLWKLFGPETWMKYWYTPSFYKQNNK